MPRDIPKQARFRPFTMTLDFENAAPAELTLTKAQVIDLIEDQLAYLADTHVSVTLSLFERVKRQGYSERILAKLDGGNVKMLTQKEVNFVMAIKAEGPNT